MHDARSAFETITPLHLHLFACYAVSQCHSGHRSEIRSGPRKVLTRHDAWTRCGIEQVYDAAAEQNLPLSADLCMEEHCRADLLCGV